MRADVDRAIAESKATSVVFLTDFFAAAKGRSKVEAEQGKMMVDACKTAGVYSVFLSVGDAEKFDAKTLHIHAKIEIEKYLKASGISGWSILRPVAFFENFDDPANYNPLKLGGVKFLTECSTFLVATYDLGKAAGVMIGNKTEWNGKTLECSSYRGTIHEVAAAFQKVSGHPTKGSLAMPICARSLFLSDLHHMCLYFENGYPGSAVDIAEFKKVVPDAMDAEAWFRYYGKFVKNA